MLSCPWRPRTRQCAVAVALLLAACGSNSEDSARTEKRTAAPRPSPIEWAGDVCTALGRWNEALAPLRANATTKAALMAARAALVDVLYNAATATATLVETLRGIGSPAIEGGRNAAAQLLDAFEPLAADLERAARDAATISTEDAAAFAAARTELAQRVATDLAAAATVLGDAANTESAELDDAFTAITACHFEG